ncbi:MAG: glycogen/starch/alpha-glucan family phosphorylase, partial [Verrucomicrobia bacterium]|nr:glycogen/starch/alpha-glucan family phosphorylase [Verrucomicrobiota bacterium]
MMANDGLFDGDDAGPARLFSGHQDALYERHLTFDRVVPSEQTTARDKFEAIARSTRDILSRRWIKTEESYRRKNIKRVYYLSMEFLTGRGLGQNLTNLQLESVWAEFCQKKGLDPLEIEEQEPDPGLGNGGLGRAAACSLDSMATLAIPGMGYGLRYEYGVFKQTLQNGWQHEHPDHWLARPDPWEVARPDQAVEIEVNCSFEIREGTLQPVLGRPSVLIGIPYDRPVVGYGGRTINTLRLWAASTSDLFDFAEFSSGDFVGALAESLTAETLTRVLYPDDPTVAGKGLRFLQEFFLVACSIADLIRRFRAVSDDWAALPDRVAIHLNGAHPSLAVPELMRILLDEARLPWAQAWEITLRTLAYTDYSPAPDALEKWPVAWFELLLPRHLQIIYEINRRLLEEVRNRFPSDEGRVQRMSLIEEGTHRQVRMAHLAIVGSHSTSGLGADHSAVLKTQTVPAFAELMPERFNNKTSGVSQRRFLLVANPALARLISRAIGSGWITDFHEFKKLRSLANDAGFQTAFLEAKREAKVRLVDWL